MDFSALDVKRVSLVKIYKHCWFTRLPFLSLSNGSTSCCHHIIPGSAGKPASPFEVAALPFEVSRDKLLTKIFNFRGFRDPSDQTGQFQPYYYPKYRLWSIKKLRDYFCGRSAIAINISDSDPSDILWFWVLSWLLPYLTILDKLLQHFLCQILEYLCTSPIIWKV